MLGIAAFSTASDFGTRLIFWFSAQLCGNDACRNSDDRITSDHDDGRKSFAQCGDWCNISISHSRECNNSPVNAFGDTPEAILRPLTPDQRRVVAEKCRLQLVGVVETPEVREGD